MRKFFLYCEVSFSIVPKANANKIIQLRRQQQELSSGFIFCYTSKEKLFAFLEENDKLFHLHLLQL